MRIVGNLIRPVQTSSDVAKLGSGGALSSVYILNTAGQQVTELNGSGAWLHSNVYTPAGRLLATYTPGAGYHYNLTDWLGTKRLQTDSSGNQEETCTSYPFGDNLTCGGTADATEQHFTGKDRDAETGLDYFGARYLNSNYGRFMSADWAAAPTTVPYAQFGNPQSLNLYAYVGNKPNTGVDVDGHFGMNNLSDFNPTDFDPDYINAQYEAVGTGIDAMYGAENALAGAGLTNYASFDSSVASKTERPKLSVVVNVSADPYSSLPLDYYLTVIPLFSQIPFPPPVPQSVVFSQKQQRRAKSQRKTVWHKESR